MTNPPPRPALQRAPDAEVHPARPGLAQLRAIPVRAEPAPEARPERTGNRPPSTSDALLGDTGARSAKAAKGKAAKGKQAKRGKAKSPATRAKIKLPADLVEQLTSKAVESGYEPDEVVALLVRAWLET